MNASAPKPRQSWRAARTWRFWIAAVPVLYVASIMPAWFLMGFLLKQGTINEGGQVIYLVFYYPIARLLGW